MIVIVSALYDLHAREPDRDARKVDEYMKYAAEFLLQLPYHLVIFCDPELATGIHKIRSREITLVQQKLETVSPYGQEMELIQSALNKNGNVDRNKKKDTAWYTVMQWTKWFLLQEAQRIMPGYFYCWMDFGINHVAKTRLSEFKICESNLCRDRVQVLAINVQPTWHEGMSLAEYYRQRRYKVGGGFWIVPSTAMTRFCRLFDRDIYYLLHQEELAPLEDEILGVMVQMQPELFCFHYGDYDDILNLDFPRHSTNLLCAGIAKCLELNCDPLRIFEVYTAVRGQIPAAMKRLLRDSLLRIGYRQLASSIT